jgi:hypothetical protein
MTPTVRTYDKYLEPAKLFAAAMFLSAALLFMVQPLAGKILLPVLGGSPSVWSTSVVFFQSMLLLGYLYAHAVSTRLTPRWQRPLHLSLLLAAGLTLPLPIQIGEPEDAHPRLWLLRSLAGTVGVPFLALSATAPLLQHWFSRTSDPRANDPYFLYAASNAGSLLGLIGYVLIEPLAGRRSQAIGWSVAFWAVAALIAACAYAYARRTQGVASGPNPKPRTRNLEPRTQNPEPRTSPSLWIVLALVPSALLVGVTEHLATDVVSMPLLWVIPLALYLTTFIATFSTGGFGSARLWGSAAPAVALLVLVLSLAEIRFPIVPITLVHLAAFTVLSMMCHARLADSRPDPAHLTSYYLCISFGGVLGGIAVAFIAPAIFSSILEYPITIAAAILLRPQSVDGRWMWRGIAALLFVAGYWSVSTFDKSVNTSELTEMTQRLFRASLALPALLLMFSRRTALLFAGTAGGLLVGAAVVRTGGEVIHRERTFFGVHQVTSIQNNAWHVLTHGTTTHGVQAVRGKVHDLPTAYYHPSGPIGDVIFTLAPEKRFRDVGVIGLGAGALAAYAADGVRMDFFEVDDAVIRIAENPSYFTHLADARARPGTTIRTMAVDGRLGLRSMPEASYDLIVVDAFSSDAIPTHLITREAVAMFMSRLKPRGVIAFHVSSRFFNLAPVLATIAEDQHLVGYLRNDDMVPPERAAEAMRPSVWMILAREDSDVGQLAHSAPRWVRLSGGGGPLWTDDYTNVLSVLEY